ncbi:MAG TPA: proprotein convertase P-domain-containing protein [Bryobacteraceae bacterium]
MRKLVLGSLIFTSFAFAQSQTFTYTYSGLPLPIYPDDWDVVGIASIIVPRSISITKVTATVQVQFSGVGDLNVFLWSAAGTRTKLLERNCGGLQNIDTTFDDAASSKFADFCPTEAGRGPFRGNEPLGNSTGQNAFGVWRLGVENNGSDKTGYLTGFSITITGTALGPPIFGPETVVSASSFDGGAIAPGDAISIFGVNLGPSGGLRASAGANLPTTLGQTSVTFDGTPAPIYFTSDRMVAVQAPATISPGSTARIQISSTAGSSVSVPVFVNAARPGVFTYEAGGKGQAKAINADGSANGDGTINGSDKPAPAGSVIQVYASGLGAVSPAVPPGTIAPTSPLSPTVLSVTASIGGRQATVDWAGAAPGMIGAYQVNILIPLGTPSGAARLFLTADNNNSQAGVTIQVR